MIRSAVTGGMVTFPRGRDVGIAGELAKPGRCERRQARDEGWRPAGAERFEHCGHMLAPGLVASLACSCESPRCPLDRLLVLVHAQDSTANRLRTTSTYDSVNGMRNTKLSEGDNGSMP